MTGKKIVFSLGVPPHQRLNPTAESHGCLRCSAPHSQHRCCRSQRGTQQSRQDRETHTLLTTSHCRWKADEQEAARGWPGLWRDLQEEERVQAMHRHGGSSVQGTERENDARDDIKGSCRSHPPSARWVNSPVVLCSHLPGRNSSVLGLLWQHHDSGKAPCTILRGRGAAAQLTAQRYKPTIPRFLPFSKHTFFQEYNSFQNFSGKGQTEFGADSAHAGPALLHIHHSDGRLGLNKGQRSSSKQALHSAGGLHRTPVPTISAD